MSAISFYFIGYILGNTHLHIGVKRLIRAASVVVVEVARFDVSKSNLRFVR